MLAAPEAGGAVAWDAVGGAACGSGAGRTAGADEAGAGASVPTDGGESDVG
jgi:hypothetical protein